MAETSDPLTVSFPFRDVSPLSFEKKNGTHASLLPRAAAGLAEIDLNENQDSSQCRSEQHTFDLGLGSRTASLSHTIVPSRDIRQETFRRENPGYPHTVGFRTSLGLF